MLAIFFSLTWIQALGADLEGFPNTAVWDTNRQLYTSLRFPDTTKTPVGKGQNLLVRYGHLMGLESPPELVLQKEETDTLGTTHQTFGQTHGGIPVFPSQIRLHFKGSQLKALQGFGQNHFEEPESWVSEEQAHRIALAWHQSLSNGDLQPGDLVWYNRESTYGKAGTARLCYRFTATTNQDQYFILADSGKAYDRLPGRHDLQRRIYSGGYDSTHLVWQEGQTLPFAGNDAALINQLIETSRHTHNLFASLTGGAYQSFDGAGKIMSCVLSPPELEEVNAFWNGAYTGFSPELVMDDVIAHEWGHAYSQYNHGLIYRWQSGALNESYSDIFGEAVDVLDGLGKDEPSPRRSDEAYSQYSAPRMELVVSNPSEISGTYPVGTASFGPTLSESGIAGMLALAQGTTGNPDECCGAIANPAAISGKIALISRGTCTFVEKVKNAQNAGAIGVVIINVQGNNTVSMAGEDASIVIPVVSVGLQHGTQIRTSLLNGPVDVTLRRDPSPRENSYRWLIGEDNGSALRDMWTPVARNDAGKVSDAVYVCGPADDTNDQGGVHSNSGVSNHAFALLVDGGRYNGLDIPGLGWTKALHIYWRALRYYQTPTSDFAIHAQALLQSAEDLVGQPLYEPSVNDGPWTQISNDQITTDDLTTLQMVLYATEMAEWPSQCQFSQVLQAGQPAACSGTPIVLLAEDFDQDPTNWTRSSQGVNPEFTKRNWKWLASGPNRPDSGLLYATNSKAYGSCTQGGDQSGQLFVESPTLQLVQDPQNAPVLLTFDHYVATESGKDGGIVQIAVNQNNWQTLSPERFTLNPYNSFLDDQAMGNTNPLAGQPGFTGKDDGANASSWGTSQVDLTSLLQAGDQFKIRFVLGVDGCGGEDGWYLDAVRVTQCSKTLSTHLESERAISHITRTTGGFSTQILLQNLSDSNQSITLQPVTAEGITLEPQSFALNASETLAQSSTDLFPDQEVAHLTITGSEQVRVSAVYRIGTGIGASAHVLESSETGLQFRIFPGEKAYVFDGVAFVNRGNGPALVEAFGLGSDGTVLSSTTISAQLGPQQKGLAVFDALQVDGVSSIRIRSDQPLATTFLRGTRVGVVPGYLYQVIPLIEQ
ncbi:MAG: M4 family metallopeptidase [Acidobacteria bacterium]|nr:M4 family metallopeptidase [Acidobacteriota bacterium]